MRKILLLIGVVLLAFGASAAAPLNKKSVRVSGIAVRYNRSLVSVAFEMQVGTKVTRNNRSLVVQPLLRSGGGQMQLPPIVVEGKRAAVSRDSRAEASGLWSVNGGPYYTKNGKTIAYHVSVPYETWMRGGELVLEGVAVEYDSAEKARMGLLAANLIPDAPAGEEPVEPVIAAVTVPAEEVNVLSKGDELARNYNFVAPVSEFERARQNSSGTLFDYNMPLNLGKGTTQRQQDDLVRFINGTSEGALAVLFRQGRTSIDRDLAENNRTLVDLISAVRAIEASGDSKVVRIVIAGFASPEGLLEDNEKLSWDRAVAVRNFLTANSVVDPGVIRVYNGSIDWQGLRKLVSESNMGRKYKIMEIIDEVPTWDAYRNVGKHGELMRLDGGEPYKYMLRNFFPQLRQAAYIKVYYQNLK